MNILFVAISCGPLRGSEDAIGWNLPIAMHAKGHNVFVLTREDKKEEIENYLSINSDCSGPNYIYVPQTKAEKLLKGPFVSAKVISWCRRVSKMLPQICDDNKIDVIHQITPIEFRSIIDLTYFSKAGANKPIAAVGPLGGAGSPGGQLINELNNGYHEHIRTFVNQHAVFSKNHQKKLEAFDVRYFSNLETKQTLMGHGASLNDDILTDIGCHPSSVVNTERLQKKQPLRVLYIGRLVPCKGLRILLKACSYLRQGSYELRLYGVGELHDELESYIKELHLENVHLMGRKEHDSIHECYEWADFFVFPSIRDCSGAVLIESLCYGVPIISFSQFGAANVINEDCGLLIDPCLGEVGFSQGMEKWINDPSSIPCGAVLNGRALDLTWENKVSLFLDAYLKADSRKAK